MTKEEYKRNLIRMFDSIRDEFKGEENCAGVDCGYNCPFFMKVCGFGQVKFHAYEAIETVEKWTKEHQILTNAMKFKEVFGIEPETQACVISKGICSDCKYADEDGCYVSNRFWNAEYNGGKE